MARDGIGRSLVGCAVVGVILGVMTGLLGLLGAAMGSGSLEVRTAVLGRTGLTLVGLVAGLFLAARWAPRSPWRAALSTILLAYLVDPFTWTSGAPAGGALFGVPVTGSTVVGVIVDALVWLLAGVAAVVMADLSQDGERDLRARPL